MDKLVADIIVETLQGAGVKHCYGVAGDTLNLTARSLDKSEIEWVSMRHEEAGAFAVQAGAPGRGSLDGGCRESAAPLVCISSTACTTWEDTSGR
ncbi:hypothetical protein ACVWWO_000190 [Bradyrhizobium sp. F1.13.1]